MEENSLSVLSLVTSGIVDILCLEIGLYGWQPLAAKKIVDKLEEKTMNSLHSVNHNVEVNLLIAWLEPFV